MGWEGGGGMSVVLAFKALVKLRIDFTNFGLNNRPGIIGNGLL